MTNWNPLPPNSRIDPWLFDRSMTSSSSSVTPVVGILAQPYYYYHHNSTNNTANTISDGNGQYDQFIAASYVKWIEMSGGRSIPIPYDMTSPSLLDELFDQMHGLLLPGGNNSTIPYAVQYMLQRSMERNAQGDYFPIWGTCLGYEMILQYFGSGPSFKEDVLQNNFNATNISLPLILLLSLPDNNTNENSTNNHHHDNHGVVMEESHFVRGRGTRSGRSHSSFPIPTVSATTTTGLQKSILYAPPNIYNSVTKYPITMNNHHQGIEPQQFQQNPYLNQYFVMTSINEDLNFRPFVSTIEPKYPYQYPIYGVQYHPEKNAFEYATYPNTSIPYEAIDHSPMGIELSFYLAEFFMNCVRFGQHMDDQKHQNDDDDDQRRHRHHGYTNPIRFPTIITYPVLSGGLSFEQIYLLPNASHWETNVHDDDDDPNK